VLKYIAAGLLLSVLLVAAAYATGVTLTIYGQTATAGGNVALQGTSGTTYNLNAIGAVSLTVGSGTGNTLAGSSAYFVCTSTCTVTPPVPSAGVQFCIENDDDVNTVITMGGNPGVYYEKTGRNGYGSAVGTMTSGGAIGDKVCIVGRDATHYLIGASVGTWTNS
jgi:hypothetical protein